MAAVLGRIFDSLLATVSTTGELGTIANWEQHLLPGAWERPEAELAKLLGRDLPADVILSGGYEGPTRIVVPALRASLESGEPLALKVLVLAEDKPGSVELLWRRMGRGAFRRVALENKARGVFTVTLPPPDGAIEYYLEVRAGGGTARFPATAPALNQTVIVLPEER
jgi:hypothetical protein